MTGNVKNVWLNWCVTYNNLALFYNELSIIIAPGFYIELC